MDAESLKVHPSINFSLVPDQDVAEYQAMGFCHVMLKIPNKSELSKLTKQERAVLKLLIAGMTITAIAAELKIHESNVRGVLSHVRAKFKCHSNLQLGLKIKALGLDIYLS